MINRKITAVPEEYKKAVKKEKQGTLHGAYNFTRVSFKLMENKFSQYDIKLSL